MSFLDCLIFQTGPLCSGNYLQSLTTQTTRIYIIVSSYNLSVAIGLHWYIVLCAKWRYFTVVKIISKVSTVWLYWHADYSMSSERPLQEGHSKSPWPTPLTHHYIVHLANVTCPCPRAVYLWDKHPKTCLPRLEIPQSVWCVNTVFLR